MYLIFNIDVHSVDAFAFSVTEFIVRGSPLDFYNLGNPCKNPGVPVTPKSVTKMVKHASWKVLFFPNERTKYPITLIRMDEWVVGRLLGLKFLNFLKLEDIQTILTNVAKNIC